MNNVGGVPVSGRAREEVIRALCPVQPPEGSEPPSEHEKNRGMGEIRGEGFETWRERQG